MTTTASARDVVTAAPAGLELRWTRDDDVPFLAGLYASTRREELAPVPWSEEEKEAFLRWQFDAQRAHYQEHYPRCEFLVVERDGEAIGRLYVDRREDEIRLVDVTLVPAHRGQGWGRKLLEALLAEGGERALPVSIHVEHNNPALRLYERLGFVHVDSSGVYYLMRWSPPAPVGGTA